MASGKHKLTARKVETAKGPCRLSDGHGLYFVARKDGGRSWSYVWIRNGKRREMGLGGVATVSLKQARDKASEVRAQIGAGLDPFAEREKAAGIKTFGEAADLLLSDLEKTWKSEKGAQQWRRSLNVVCEPIRKLPVNEIDTAQVLRIVKPVWKATPETGSRVRSRIERVLNFAATHNWRSGENPARWKGHLEFALDARARPPIKHFPAMPYVDVPAFVSDLQSRESVAALALEFTILTAARTGEVIGAVWPEIDFDAALWTIPAERMKAGAVHTVPLTPRAVEILRALYEVRQSEYVFSGKRPKSPLSNMAMTMLLRRMGLGQFTVHGFRAAFRTWAGNETVVQREVAEAALSHTIGDITERSYSRGNALEKRRGLMILWADYCAGLHNGEVVALHG